MSARKRWCCVFKKFQVLWVALLKVCDLFGRFLRIHVNGRHIHKDILRFQIYPDSYGKEPNLLHGLKVILFAFKFNILNVKCK